MIHTEQGKLTELIEMIKADRMFVAEALGVGPSGARSRDKTLLVDSPRQARFSKRLDNLTAVLEILEGLR